MLGLHLLALVVGLGWTVANFALGHAGGGDGDGGQVHTGGGFGAGDGDGGFGEAVGGDGGGALDLPLFSPTAIAGYLTGFGATGLGLHRGLGIENPLVHVPASLVGAAVLGVGVAWITVRVLAYGEVSSAEGPEALAGRPGEVTVTIPAGGVGEIAFLSGGRRNAGAARAVGGAAVPRGARVRIVRLEGATYLVQPAGEPALAELPPRHP